MNSHSEGDESSEASTTPLDDSHREAVAGRGRKVVILGDTISSVPIAPLSLGCDVIAHEATFSQGVS